MPMIGSIVTLNVFEFVYNAKFMSACCQLWQHFHYYIVT